MDAFDDLKKKAETHVKADEAATKAWMGTNWVPLAVGILIGILAMVAIHHL